MTATALVQTGPRKFEEHKLPVPDLVEGSALVRVEACGLCGSDLEYYAGEQVIGASRYPRILGHEIVGVVEALGPTSENRKGLAVGDRVAVDPILSCGTCRMCVIEPNRMFCQGYGFAPAFYGTIPTTIEPGLWGGYATHVYIHPDAVLYRFPASCDPLTATLWNPLAAGIQWAATEVGTTVGTTVAVLGAGQRGLACVIAARAAGASLVVVTGLTKDRHKLDLALEFGADAAIDVESEDALERVLDLTDGQGVDVVVDTSSRSTQPVLDALALVRRGGTIVWYGIKGGEVARFPIDTAIYKGVTIKAATGLSRDSFRRAVDLIVSGRFPLERLRTHIFAMHEAERAMDVLAGRVAGERPINVVLTPGWA